jgi:hypothetical protein
MKAFLSVLVALVTVLPSGQAGPIRPSQIPEDARWVIHLDVDRLLKTRLGEYVTREFLEKKLSAPLAQLKQQMDVEVDWKKIHSVTVYGWEIKGHGRSEPMGVVLVQSDLEVPAALDQVMGKLETQLGAAELPLRKSEETLGTIYQLKEEAFGAGASGGVFVLARKKEHLLTALGRLTERPAKPAAAVTGTWRGLGESGDAFLVLGVAEGLVDLSSLPKQAHVLKEASGGRLMAGEKAENLFVSVALDTKTAETAAQIQQLLQGLIALANLSGNENADLQKLAQGARVEGREKQVILALEYPSRDVITRLTASASEDHSKKRRRAPKEKE